MQSLRNWPPRSALRRHCRRLLLASFFLLLLPSCLMSPPAVEPAKLPELPERLRVPLPPFPDVATLPDGSSTVGMVVEWGQTIRVLYEQAGDRVAQIIAFYESLRAAQKESP